MGFELVVILKEAQEGLRKHPMIPPCGFQPFSRRIDAPNQGDL